MIQPIQRVGLRKRLATHLHDAILRAEFHPGQRIVEGKLARQLGVAQASLREALQVLEHQGLVRKQDNCGTFVVKLTCKDVEDIYVVRRRLEPLAARLARERMTEEQYTQLVKLVDQMEVAGARGDFVDLVKKDLDFHRLIWGLSGSQSIIRALEAVCPPLFGSYLMKAPAGKTYNQARDLDEHRTLVHVFRDGGPEEVQRAFEEIMEVFRLQDIENLQAVNEAVSPSHSFPDTHPEAVKASGWQTQSTELKRKLGIRSSQATSSRR
jgi:DNA-binding GntR family transcriptional regulator